MKTEVNTISAVIAAALGALLSYCVQLLIPLIILILVMILDYGTGMAKAWCRGELSSRIGIRGILKKLGYIITVAVAGVADWLVAYGLQSVGIEYHLPFLLAAIVMTWLIINELISIMENVAAIGGPMPPFLVKLLARLKSSVEDKTGAAADSEECYKQMIKEINELRQQLYPGEEDGDHE